MYPPRPATVHAPTRAAKSSPRRSNRFAMSAELPRRSHLIFFAALLLILPCLVLYRVARPAALAVDDHAAAAGEGALPADVERRLDAAMAAPVSCSLFPVLARGWDVCFSFLLRSR